MVMRFRIWTEVVNDLVVYCVVCMDTQNIYSQGISMVSGCDQKSYIKAHKLALNYGVRVANAVADKEGKEAECLLLETHKDYEASEQ